MMGWPSCVRAKQFIACAPATMRSILFAPLALFCASASEERVRVRLLHTPTDAVSTASLPTPSSSSRQQAPTAFRVPYRASGPPALLALRGRCFFVDVPGVKSYEYSICPYANVTQRETGGQWNAFYGLLGLWDDWLPPQSGAAAMRGRFSDGTDCSGARRVAVVSFTCSGPAGVYAIKGIVEPKTCEYELTFACPEACGVDAETVRPRGENEAPIEPTPTPSATPSAEQQASATPKPSPSPAIPAPSIVSRLPLPAAQDTAALMTCDNGALMKWLDGQLIRVADSLAAANETLTEVRATLALEGDRNKAGDNLPLAPEKEAVVDESSGERVKNNAISAQLN